jgi:prepilin-type N-terminal cleavage/methylation domain-containing protein
MIVPGGEAPDNTGGRRSRGTRLEQGPQLFYKRGKRERIKGQAMTNLNRRRRARRGFTLIEVLVVIGIIGIITLASYPSILNILESRNLDNAARQVQTYLQQTKLRAVDTKIVHRVRFYQAETGNWVYEMERLQIDGTWARVEGPPRKEISARFDVTLTLPESGGGHVAIFTPVGSVASFAVNQNAIVLRSPKLDRPGQMDERVISLYMGGSIQYAKRASS